MYTRKQSGNNCGFNQTIMTTLREQFEAMIKEAHRTYNPDYSKWILDLMQKAYDMPRWVECRPDKPKEDGYYLVLDQDGDITIEKYEKSELDFDTGAYITHWQPLPEKPSTQK